MEIYQYNFPWETTQPELQRMMWLS